MKELAIWLLVIPLLIVFSGAVTMIAWNMSMPPLFGLPKATLSSGLGLAILVSIVRQPTLEPKRCR
jgi:hypothetical protein